MAAVLRVLVLAGVLAAGGGAPRPEGPAAGRPRRRRARLPSLFL